MPDRRKLYFYHKPDPETKEIVAPLYNLATRSKFDLVKDYRSANIIVSIGDDDTFLQAVRNTGFRDDCLYTGVSFTDKRSMYCDFQLNNLSSIIDAMTNDNLEVRRYPTIDVKIDEETSFQCLNEFSVRSSIIRTFVMDVFIDQLHFETFRGNGMIVSTPTGSTGYTRSVNGSIVDPLIPCLQVSEVASLNTNDYRSLGSSIILAGGRRLTLKVVQDGNDYPIMGIDNEALSIQHVEKIEVQLSNKQVKTLKLKNNSFWEKVRRAFL